MHRLRAAHARLVARLSSRVLGIETSCDDTAAAIVTEAGDVLGASCASQTYVHSAYGGIVPALAAREHLAAIRPVLRQTLEQARCEWDDVDAIACTTGPGLGPSLRVGLLTAKSLALELGKPFIAVNHLEAHALIARIKDPLAFPFLVFLTSGGHCELAVAHGVHQYELLGATRDDAPGEAFDKVARLLQLDVGSTSGGAAVAAAAARGDSSQVSLPIPMRRDATCDMSFSGLKSAVARYVEARCAAGSLDASDVENICASFEDSVVTHLSERLRRALLRCEEHCLDISAVVLCGGVASNSALRRTIGDVARVHGVQLRIPPPELCADNGVMIGWAAHEMLRAGLQCSSLDTPYYPQWPLEDLERAAPHWIA